jgi:hypothetical protein
MCVRYCARNSLIDVPASGTTSPGRNSTGATLGATYSLDQRDTYDLKPTNTGSVTSTGF